MVKPMFNLFGRRRATRRIEVIQRDPCRLTVTEWRSDPVLVQQAQKILANPEFRQLLDVIERSSPARWELDVQAAHSESRIALQSIIQGYMLAITNLESLGHFQPKGELPEETFEPENFNLDLPQT